MLTCLGVWIGLGLESGLDFVFGWMQWRRNEFENGGRGGHRSATKIFGRVPPLFWL